MLRCVITGLEYIILNKREKTLKIQCKSDLNFNAITTIYKDRIYCKPGLAYADSDILNPTLKEAMAHLK